MNVEEKARQLHSKLKGKIKIAPATKLTKQSMPLLYTPGVAQVARDIATNKNKSYDYTWKGNSVAIVSNGSRLLGLGDVGPYAALPVMEGKALIYSQYGSINAVPLCIDAQTVDEIVTFVTQIAPTFGAINIEDIRSPDVFSIVDQLSRKLSIPVFHDDQHGTAVACVAGLLNALKVTGKKIAEVRIIVSGAGSAGYGITKLLVYAGVKKIQVVDSKGLVTLTRTDLNNYKKELAHITKQQGSSKDLTTLLEGADVFIGVSGQGKSVSSNMIRSMNDKSIVFALSNPVSELSPEEAIQAGAGIAASGSSSAKIQINNSIVFPFLMRKILKEKILKLNESFFYKTACTIASAVRKPTTKKILPTLEEMKNVRL